MMMSDLCKCLKFPVVPLPSVGYMQGKGKEDHKAARVFCVAATQARQRLVIGVGGDGGVGWGWRCETFSENDD